ncbi:MAG: septum formation initiator family protein [Nannocystaceae bacterium]|nr:septum formation initiator family protein [Nannocystaceae bacterium]
MTQPKPSSLRRRQQALVEFAHGWGRRGDATEPVAMSAAGRHRRAPAGTSLLLLVIVGVFTALGIARVHASTRVLGFGAQITDLTEEQAELLDKRRRLGAERAYLRHPDQIREVARDRLGMIPMSPDVMQSIRLKEVAPAPGEDR